MWLSVFRLMVGLQKLLKRDGYCVKQEVYGVPVADPCLPFADDVIIKRAGKKQRCGNR